MKPFKYPNLCCVRRSNFLVIPPFSRVFAIEDKKPDCWSKTLEINLDLALKVASRRAMIFKPTSFKTSDGNGGWTLRFPAAALIATPAYADGMLFRWRRIWLA